MLVRIASQNINYFTLSYPSLCTGFEHTIDLSSKRSEPGNLSINRNQMLLRNRIDGCTGGT